MDATLEATSGIKSYGDPRSMPVETQPRSAAVVVQVLVSSGSAWRGNKPRAEGLEIVVGCSCRVVYRALLVLATPLASSLEIMRLTGCAHLGTVNQADDVLFASLRD